MSALFLLHQLSTIAPQQQHGRPRSRRNPQSNDPILDFRRRLLSSGTLELDHLTFPSLFRACSDRAATAEGRQLHAQAIKGDFVSDAFVQRSILRMYARFLACDDALKVFARCPGRDVVSCNDLIVGLCRIGDLVAARKVFDGMPVRNVVSWSVMVDGYARNGQLELAQELFDAMPERNHFSWNSLISGYLRFGHVEVARNIFDRMRTQWGVITWTAMISGYVHNSQHKNALNLFLEMQDAGVPPNEVTVVSVLPAVAELGALSHGRRIHAYIIDTMGIEISSVLGSALVDMYSNCGCIEDAITVFEKLKHKDLSAWNSIISGLAAHGRGSDALRLFYKLQNDLKMIPNDITFTAALSACSHTGLVEEGRRIFRLFTDHYKLKPNVRHYGCMVDLLARAGRLREALAFVERMPIEPNPIIWKSLISGCRTRSDAELVEGVCRKVVELGPQDSGSYVLVSNILNAVGREELAGKVRRRMNDLGVKKVAGCSWIELDGVTHRFLMGRESFHARGMEIRGVLHEMQELMRLEEYNLDISDQWSNDEGDDLLNCVTFYTPPFDEI